MWNYKIMWIRFEYVLYLRVILFEVRVECL